MATPLIGNIIISNIRTNISATTATGVTSGATQVLASNILANPTLGSGNYIYQWTQTGTVITFTAATSNSTNCTYNSLSVAGSTTIYCTVTDTWTGVQSVTANCVITWPVQIIPITAVTWKYSNSNSPTTYTSISANTNITYTGYTYTIVVDTVTPGGATYSIATTTATNVGPTNASTTITGTSPYSGIFTSPNLTIVAATLTGTAANPSADYTAGSQTGTVITGVNATPGNYTGSTTITATNAGSYGPTTITGFGNYTGIVNGGTFTINKVTCTLTGSASIFRCPPLTGYNGQIMNVTGCGGLLSGGVGTLTVYLKNKVTGVISVAPVLPDSEVDGVWNGSTNPTTGLSNGTNTARVLFPSGTYEYGFSFGGDSNYNASEVGAFNGDSCNT